VEPGGDWAARLESAGWPLDEGSVHPGQGTRNRRLLWPQHYLELIWVADDAEARGNPLRLDRRGAWARTGASPFGYGFRGQVPAGARAEFWRYDALGVPIWIHRDDERHPERPLVFVLETPPSELAARRPAARVPQELLAPGALTAIRATGPAPAPLPACAGPPIAQERGPHRLELVVANGGTPVRINNLLVVRG